MPAFLALLYRPAAYAGRLALSVLLLIASRPKHCYPNLFKADDAHAVADRTRDRILHEPG